MRKIFSAMLVAATIFVGAQGMVSAAALLEDTTTPNIVLREDEDVTLVVDEPVESGDILVDEDGDVWEVQ
ncbi:MAG: hypothetical protein K6C05_03760 [Anaerovibrio sp.]|uniref:hypothetical protein n=1 Tax=Anaerovibrio sp. TaxID=1872532 RepID=UPI0025D31E42|nr:hypothetical protein [Anaerovibrio sp.]MCR5175947.1 hypothetical protein [Anaerovibrio sp.]